LLRTGDVAKLLAVSERTVSRLAKDGTIPSIHFYRSVRFSREMLETWLKNVFDGASNRGYNPRHETPLDH
jgi:excisionase family DNA binding protein